MKTIREIKEELQAASGTGEKNFWNRTGRIPEAA